MASVYIYQQHRDILDEMISSSRVASAGASFKTGPFRDQRDAYVFAASLAIALDPEMDRSGTISSNRSSATPIRDSVFFGAKGATELAYVVGLVGAPDGAREDERDRLVSQLEQISEEHLDERLERLDRFAYAGFEWLRTNREDEATINDLLAHALSEVTLAELEPLDYESIKDPLLEFLL